MSSNSQWQGGIYIFVGFMFMRKNKITHIENSVRDSWQLKFLGCGSLSQLHTSIYLRVSEKHCPELHPGPIVSLGKERLASVCFLKASWAIPWGKQGGTAVWETPIGCEGWASFSEILCKIIVFFYFLNRSKKCALLVSLDLTHIPQNPPSN